ncbi:MAG: hypothetical protein ACRCXE_02405, partial [Metamycoplasmataceae bacterium]
MNNKNNQIKKNGILTFKYDMYDKEGNWMMGNGPISISVGNNDSLLGLSDALIGLDYTIKNQTIDFRYYPNKNDPTYQNVDLDLEIYSYNNHQNAETKERHHSHNDQNVDNQHPNQNQNRNHEVDFESLDSKKMKNVKKEIKELQKEIEHLSKKIVDLNKNENL